MDADYGARSRADLWFAGADCGGAMAGVSW